MNNRENSGIHAAYVKRLIAGAVSLFRCKGSDILVIIPAIRVSKAARKRKEKRAAMEEILYQGTLGTVKRNNDRNLVEIYFDSRPSSNTLEALKLLSWRYFSKKVCWYNRYNPENTQLAIKLCGEVKDTPVEEIDYYISPVEVLIVTSIRSCIYREHNLVRGTASANVLKNGAVKEALIPVFYCRECGVY